METIIEIDLNPEYHVSKFLTTNVRKFALYIPTIDQIMPNESHYFGINKLTYGNIVINQEKGMVALTLRQFFKALLSNMPYAYEIACTPISNINPEFQLGIDILNFGKSNLISKSIVDTYIKNFTYDKINGNYTRAYRFGTILKRLYSGLRTTEMTLEETTMYGHLLSDTIKLEDIEFALTHMDIEFQSNESLIHLDEIYPQVDINYINQYLIRTHKDYLKI
jgi:hypothetical protein